MYYEETEMQHRFFSKGYKSFIINTPKIIHLEGASSAQSDNKRKNILRKINRGLQGRFTYARKVFSGKDYFIFRLMHLLMIPRVLLAISTLKDKKETFKIIFGKII